MNRHEIGAIAFGVLAGLMLASNAVAHGVAGKRFFPPLATDDPFVADELSLPTVSMIKRSVSGEEPATIDLGQGGRPAGAT